MEQLPCEVLHNKRRKGISQKLRELRKRRGGGGREKKGRKEGRRGKSLVR